MGQLKQQLGAVYYSTSHTDTGGNVFYSTGTLTPTPTPTLTLTLILALTVTEDMITGAGRLH